MFWPATITVHLHDTIDTANVTKEEVPELRMRVRNVVRESVEKVPVNDAGQKTHSEEHETTS